LLFPKEETEIRKEVADLVADPDKRLANLNSKLGGTAPRSLIGTNQEQILRSIASDQVRYAHMNLAGCHTLSTTPETNNYVPNTRQAWIILNVQVTLQAVADLTIVQEQGKLLTTAQE
jgi:hypothetical protein